MFTVGEFSTLAQVSKRLLRYYDEIGLLKPTHTDPSTGYRYYSAEQLADLNRILVLKELGLSLEQISRIRGSDISTDEMQGMLLLKKAEIEQLLQSELQRIRKIEARLGAIRNAEAGNPLDVVIKQIPAQSALSVTGVFESFEAAMRIKNQIRMALPERRGYGLCYIICHDHAIVEQDMNLEIGCLMDSPQHKPLILSESLSLTHRQLPAVEMMATTIVRGALEMIHASYGEMGLWVNHHAYRIVGIPREITLKTAQSSDGRDLITEIQFPIQTLA